jgi:alkylhydroperoxidase family enzyme
MIAVTSGRTVSSGECQAWANAAKQYDDDQLAALVSLIGLTNAYNRFNVITRQPAGDYQPGQW